MNQETYETPENDKTTCDVERTDSIKKFRLVGPVCPQLAPFDIESLLLLGVDLPEHCLCTHLGSRDGTSGHNSTHSSTRTVIH
jgi:hypothetical protein